MAGSGVALARANTALAQFNSQDLFVVNGANPGLDAYGAIMTAVNKCKTAGGGRVLLPWIGGYTISAPIVVDFDNCTILLDDDCTFTMTNPTRLVGPNAPYQSGVNGNAIVGFLFGGRITGPTTGRNYIKAPQLIGLRRVTINTNAQNVTGYTYVVGAAGGHAPVVFFGTINGRCENIVALNGLTGGIAAFYNPEMVIENCIANTTLYDNGITIGSNREHIATYSDTDPTTWSNAKLINCTGINCANHGVSIYGAVGVTEINPIAIGCGNNRTGVQDPSGPAGGIGIENDGTNVTRDYRATIINPRADNCYGFGLRTNCKGTRVIGGRITGTKNPTNYTDSTPKVWGSGVFVQGAGTLELIGTDVENSDQVGIRMASSSGNYPSLYMNGGKISGNGQNPAGTTGAWATAAALYANDFAEIVISPDTLFEANGNTSDTTAGNQYTVNLNNSSSNIDAGLAVIAGRFEANSGGVVLASRVGTLDLTKGITGNANGAAWASAYHMLWVVDKVSTLHAGNIILSQGGNGKTARVLNVANAVYGYVNHYTIIGDQAGSSVPRVQIAVSGSNYSTPPQGYVTSGGVSSYTPNSTYGNVVFGSPYLNSNLTINADAPTATPIDGQTITFTLIQDATGGRTVTWNAAWKGASLTSAGTANQRAQVTFRYSGGIWQQIANTGWLS